MTQFPLPAAYQRSSPRLVDDVSPDVDRGEVYRYLGYPAGREPKAGIQDLVDLWVARAVAQSQPRASYLVLPVAELTPRRITVEHAAETTSFDGAIGEFLGPAQFAALFIATAGPGVEALASKLLAAGDTFAALVVNSVGAERAEAAETVVLNELRENFREIGFAATLPYSPGYCGMALTEQRKLFALLEDQTVGVELTDECLMRPLKSVSGIVGLGPVDQVEQFGSPCERCELYNCAMRR